MNAERLLQLYDRVSDAPDAVPRLRRFILDLAVRGKLVEQDPDDEPASELLRHIERERNVEIKSRKIDSEQLSDSRSEASAAMPEGWALVPLGDVVIKHLGGGTPSKSNLSYWDGDIRWASVKDVGKAKYLDDTIDRITSEGLTNSSSNLIPPGQLIVVTRMGLGKVSINRVTVAINQDLRALFLSSSVSVDYCFNFFLTHQMDGTGLTVKGIKVSELVKIPFPLPPLAEQHRIVAKVDELMALCDSLEAEREEREATRDRLTTASLSRLTAPDVDEKQFKAHADFAIKVLPELTTRPDQIKVLRQTILDLAVRGKLVKQDPKEEAVSALLLRLQRGRDARRKAIWSEVGEEVALLRSLPNGWAWTTIDQIASHEDNAIADGPFGAKLKTAHYVSEAGFRVIRLQNIGHGSFRDENRSFIDRAHFDSLSKHHVKPGDLVVAGLVDSGVRCAEVPACIGPALVKADCYRLAVHPELCARFFLHYLNSPTAREFAAAHHHGMTLTRIGLGNFRQLPVPLPPVNEQLRIVTQVDKLMRVCDHLEQGLDSRRELRRRLFGLLFSGALEPLTMVAA